MPANCLAMLIPLPGGDRMLSVTTQYVVYGADHTLVPQLTHFLGSQCVLTAPAHSSLPSPVLEDRQLLPSAGCYQEALGCL